MTDRVLGDDDGEALREATETLGRLDLAAARASHAAWLGARPATLVVDGPDAEARAGRDAAPASFEPRLPRLPRGGKVGAEEETEGWDEDESDEDHADEDETNARVETRAEVRDVARRFPLPAGTPLVAITGPNTGRRRRRSRRSVSRFSWRARVCTCRRTTPRRRACPGRRTCSPIWATRRASPSRGVCPRSPRT